MPVVFRHLQLLSQRPDHAQVFFDREEVERKKVRVQIDRPEVLSPPLDFDARRRDHPTEELEQRRLAPPIRPPKRNNASVRKLYTRSIKNDVGSIGMIYTR